VLAQQLGALHTNATTAKTVADKTAAAAVLVVAAAAVVVVVVVLVGVTRG